MGLLKTGVVVRVILILLILESSGDHTSRILPGNTRPLAVTLNGLLPPLLVVGVVRYPHIVLVRVITGVRVVDGGRGLPGSHTLGPGRGRSVT